MIEALILGIVQGITEFFPVSSTAHLIVLPWFFKWSGDLDTLTFDVALHAGTLLSLLLCFWRDWAAMLVSKRRLFFLIVIASIPAGVTGFFLNDIIEESLRSPYVISIALIVVGIVMLLSEKMFQHRSIESVKLPDALLIGIAQVLALIPGVSRSGITISAGLFRGLDRSSSARFSFLLATPVIAGATLLHANKLISGAEHYNLDLFMAGFAASAVTGFAAITFLMSFFKKYTLNAFVYYRFFLAAVIISGIWLRT
ncbi:MAG: undecaprenyl-diphosphate phosphatase [Nitrospirota bacterium]|nr:undecaprenyl-diphosphate phosphatase [Nitrospirota bacterium]